MYAANRQQVEEFIRHGAPSSWLEKASTRERLTAQRIRMPAYQDKLSEKELNNLIAYACAVEAVDLPGGEAAAAGRSLASKHGCLSCHGVEGSGGLPNPGSFGGFIPGFVGGNFRHLVRDEEEFRQWIVTGTSPRLAKYPWVRFFWRRQRLSMPAYGEALGQEELGQLWQWVLAVRGEAAD
jgi:mono/diheme cytochrome c family protein